MVRVDLAEYKIAHALNREDCSSIMVTPYFRCLQASHRISQPERNKTEKIGVAIHSNPFRQPRDEAMVR
jgi:hypothetical protein